MLPEYLDQHPHLATIVPPITSTSDENEFPITGNTYADIVELFVSTLRTDRSDGLFSTVVCDEHNRCLGLVYSSRESIVQAFLTRKGVYYSRSRNSIWHKGLTSGHVQELLCMSADCDSDALRYIVVQHGSPPAFCHLHTYTCWGNSNGLHKLETTLKQRKANAPIGSYTRKLFEDSNLLRQKLLEEVQELIEANEKEHIAAEAADVMYFMMTRYVF
jgi:phosphoribosyl-ATP pyrophosphohydrolase / phosphoribosyl-AMP cyclohydrolase / histidinol dehydrogenase